MGANPLQAWIIFRPYFHYCLSNDLTAKIAFILTSLFSVHRKLYDFHVFTVSALNSFSQIRNKVKFMFLCVYRFRILSWKEKKLYIFHSAPWIWIFRSFKMSELRIQYGFLHDLTNAKSTGNLEFREGLVRKYSAVKRLICCRGTT